MGRRQVRIGRLFGQVVVLVWLLSVAASYYVYNVDYYREKLDTFARMLP